MSGQANVLSNSVTPLIDRILTNPLTFILGKQIELNNSEKPASYIVLSKSSKRSDNIESHKVLEQEKESKGPEMRKPRSMAEAVAVYTGKKFLSKAEKKAAKRRKVAQPLIDSEEEDVGEVVGGDPKMAESDSDSISDSQYESASEFQSDSNVELPFTEFKSESELKSSSELRSDSEVKSESELKSDSESTSESPVDGDEENDDDDDDEDDNKDYSLGDNESLSESDSGSASDAEESSDDDEDLDALKHDLKQDLQRDPKEATSKDPSLAGTDDEDEEKEDDNLDKNTTPPTSPEDEPEKVAATVVDNKDLDVLPLSKFYQINEVSNDRGSNNSTRIHKNWRELSKRKPVGLLNHGVTCYMNSAIQSLIHIPAVQHYLTDINSGKYNKTLKPRSVSV